MWDNSHPTSHALHSWHLSEPQSVHAVSVGSAPFVASTGVKNGKFKFEKSNVGNPIRWSLAFCLLIASSLFPRYAPVTPDWNCSEKSVDAGFPLNGDAIAVVNAWKFFPTSLSVTPWKVVPFTGGAT